MEYFELTLEQYLESRTRVPEKTALQIYYEIVRAISNIDEQSVIHCDINPHNICLSKKENSDQYSVKLTHFTYSQKEIGRGRVGSDLEYLSPIMMQDLDESVINDQGYTSSVDYWSATVILYRMLLGFTPFEFKSLAKWEIKSVIQNQSGPNLKFPTNVQVSEPVKALLRKFLDTSKAKNIHEDSILDDPLMNEFGSGDRTPMIHKIDHRYEKSSILLKSVRMSRIPSYPSLSNDSNDLINKLN